MNALNSDEDIKNDWMNSVPFSQLNIYISKYQLKDLYNKLSNVLQLDQCSKTHVHIVTRKFLRIESPVLYMNFASSTETRSIALWTQQKTRKQKHGRRKISESNQ